MSSILAALHRLLDTRPLLAAATGTASGLVTVLISWGETLNLLFKLAGGFFGACCAGAAFLFILPRLLRFLRAWRARGLLNADKD